MTRLSEKFQLLRCSSIEPIELTGMLEIALTCVLMPSLSWMFEKLFTPVPPTHVQFVVHETVDPSSDVRCEHWLPEVAPDSPQRSSSRE